MKKLVSSVCGSVFVCTLVVSCNKDKSDGSRNQSIDKITTSCVAEQNGVSYCLEYSNYPAVLKTAQESCDEEKGIFTSGQACSRENALVGCIQGDDEALSDNANSRLVIWYYKNELLTEKAVAEKVCGDSKFVVNP
jgi:hypothetical protein